MSAKLAYSSSTQLLGPQAGETSGSYELDEVSTYQPSVNQHISTTPEYPLGRPDRPLGKPAKKHHYIDYTDAAAVVLSTVCLGVSLAVISSRYDLSFRLGYTNQLVVIGFLLGIMNLCAKRVLQLPFLLIEANFGRSHLQNYDAILRDSPFVSKASLPWKITLFCFTALPFGLSASYKLFQGGSVTKSIDSTGISYGLVSPAGLGTNGGELVIMANTTVDFLTASGNDSIGIDVSELPQAFGLNTLLLSSTSAAYLDLPIAEDVLAKQSSLEPGTHYDLTAIVRGTVSIYNNVSDDFRDNTTYWDNLYQYADLNSQTLYNGFIFGYLAVNTATDNDPAAWDDSWAWIGCYASDAAETQNATQTAFQANALHFVTDRRLCNATWRITRDSLRLIDGTCDSAPLNATYQYLTNTELALQQIYASVLSSYLGPFCSTRKTSSWYIPTHVVTVAAMYYSRTVQLLANDGDIPVQYPYYYEYGWQPYSTTENLTLTKPVMLQSWALYVILACQPCFTILAFVVTIFFRQTPLRRGFGIVSILAGIDAKTLHVLQGASMSGELSEPVKLKITNVEVGVAEQPGARVGYAIGRKSSETFIH